MEGSPLYFMSCLLLPLQVRMYVEEVMEVVDLMPQQVRGSFGPHAISGNADPPFLLLPEFPFALPYHFAADSSRFIVS